MIGQDAEVTVRSRNLQLVRLLRKSQQHSDAEVGSDEDDAFVSRCNMGMIDVEPLPAEDEALVLGLVEEHVAQTGSARGKALLASWPDVVGRVKKVVPVEYKRILETRDKEARWQTPAAS